MQIMLSDRWLMTLNATAEVAEMVLPEGEWRAVPPFAGEDNPVTWLSGMGPRTECAYFKGRNLKLPVGLEAAARREGQEAGSKKGVNHG
jgi:hypothetical protein